MNSPVVTWSLVGGLGATVLMALGHILKEARNMLDRQSRPREPWERL
jgi:hypothetical protein